MVLDELVKTIDNDDFEILKKKFPDKCEYLKKIAFQYEYFNCIDDYQKWNNNFKKEDFLSRLKNACHDDGKIERIFRTV